MNKAKEALFKGLPQNERIDALRESAVTSYNKNVIRNFSDEELTEMKDQLSTVDIHMNDAEIEKKEITKEVNDRIKVFKEKRGELLKHLKNKYFESVETVYDVDNQEEGVMETYDSLGTLIATRRLTPKERQNTIKLHSKSA